MGKKAEKQSQKQSKIKQNKVEDEVEAAEPPKAQKRKSKETSKA